MKMVRHHALANLLQFTVTSAMEDFRERARHLGHQQRDVVFSCGRGLNNFGELLNAALPSERRLQCAVVSLYGHLAGHAVI